MTRPAGQRPAVAARHLKISRPSIHGGRYLERWYLSVSLIVILVGQLMDHLVEPGLEGGN